MAQETRTRTPAARFLGVYAELMAGEDARSLATVSLVSKFPISMFPVSAVLLLSPRYSYTAAGLAVGAMSLANALSSPARARLVARRGAPGVLLPCLFGYLAGLTGFVLAAAWHLPISYPVSSAVLIGLCFPPVSMLLRGYWTSLDRARGRTSANALESALMDVTLITGPVVASSLSTSVAATAPFAAVGVLMAAAVVLLLRVRDMRAPQTSSRAGTGHWARPLRSGALLSVFGAQFVFCAGLSAIEVALPIYAQQQHAAGHSGWYLAGLSVGSIVGALLLGGFAPPASLGLPRLLGAFTLGAVALGLGMVAGPTAVLLVCPLTGLAIGSTFSRLFSVIGTLTPPGTDHEAQGWANAVNTIGFAAGASVGAALADAHGATATLTLAPSLGAIGALCAVLASRTARGRAGSVTGASAGYAAKAAGSAGDASAAEEPGMP